MPLKDTQKRKEYLKEYNKKYHNSEACKKSREKYRKTDKCKELTWGYRIKAKYGISVAEYNKLFQKQNGVCAICGRTNKRRLVVDHNHITGEVRGLLCDNCNKGIGLMGDSIPLFEKAIKYISKA